MKRRWQASPLSCALVVGRHTSTAAAFFPHRLTAQLVSIIDQTYDPDVFSVAADFQDGVPGIDPSARTLYASVNSAMGVLRVSGVTVAKLDPKDRAFAGLQQQMTFSSGDFPFVVDAVLDFGASAGGGFTQLDDALRVGDCVVSVSGDFGGSGDVKNAEFLNHASLTIETQGRDAFYESPTFLTQVPEPEHGFVAALGALACLTGRRAAAAGVS